MEPLRDRLRTADPLFGRRRVFAWIGSVLVHAVVLAGVAVFTVRTAKGLKTERTLHVGLLAKPATSAEPARAESLPGPTDLPNPEALQNQADRSLEPAPRDPLPALEFDRALLATAGRGLNGARSAHPAPHAGGAPARPRFLGVDATGASFVWVIDRSASMSHRDALDWAKRELLSSLSALEGDHSFQVLFYHTEVLPLTDAAGTLLKATPANLQRTRRALANVSATGGTKHVPALLAAITLRPEVIFFLTDADMMTDADVALLTAANRQSPRPASIHAFEFGSGPDLFTDKPLRKLALENDGTYSYVDIEKRLP